VTPFGVLWICNHTASLCITLPQRTTHAEPAAWGIRPYRLERLNKKEKARKELLIFLVIYSSASSSKTS